jgi:hypothetical protein
MSSEHDHSRPDRAAQLAAVRLVGALLADDRPAIRDAAATGCGACTAVAAASLMFTLTSELGGTKPERLAAALLPLVGVAERELRSAPN